MPHDVFISHAAKDKVVADAVCATLESRKIRCWIAPRDVLPGVSFSEAIVDAISASRVMIVFFSSHSNASEHVIREVKQAVTKGVTILPLRIEEVPLSKDMDYFLGTTHWLDAFTPPIERHFQSVADTVSLLLSRASGQMDAGAVSNSLSRPAGESPEEAGDIADLEGCSPDPRVGSVPRHRHRSLASLARSADQACAQSRTRLTERAACY